VSGDGLSTSTPRAARPRQGHRVRRPGCAERIELHEDAKGAARVYCGQHLHSWRQQKPKPRPARSVSRRAFAGTRPAPRRSATTARSARPASIFFRNQVLVRLIQQCAPRTVLRGGRPMRSDDGEDDVRRVQRLPGFVPPLRPAAMSRVSKKTLSFPKRSFSASASCREADCASMRR
jgi:hypothetical protein